MSKCGRLRQSGARGQHGRIAPGALDSRLTRAACRRALVARHFPWPMRVASYFTEEFALEEKQRLKRHAQGAQGAACLALCVSARRLHGLASRHLASCRLPQICLASCRRSVSLAQSLVSATD